MGVRVARPEALGSENKKKITSLTPSMLFIRLEENKKQKTNNVQDFLPYK